MLLIQTLATFTLIALIWFVNTYNGREIGIYTKIIFIILLIAGLIFEWFRFFHQKNSDSLREESKILTTVNKFEGAWMKVYAIGYFFSGVIFILGGIFWVFQGTNLWYLGFPLILAGIIALYLAVKYFWWRSHPLSEGRYY